VLLWLFSVRHRFALLSASSSSMHASAVSLAHLLRAVCMKWPFIRAVPQFAIVAPISAVHAQQRVLAT
jgi:hypothetical protein